MEIKILKRIVSDSTGVDLNNQDKNSNRIQQNVFARMIYFTLCKEYTKLSLAAIGKTLKPSKDHSTVLYNVRQMDNFLTSPQNSNKEIKSQYNNIKSKIEYIKDKIKETDVDFITALQRLSKLEETNRRLMKFNIELLEEIQKIKGGKLYKVMK